MQSRLLRSFLVVAQKGSITDAAETLHVSQPALTKSIQRLEDDLNVKLFDRIAVGVCLTKYGEILLQHVKIMENEYQHAVSSIEELRNGRGGVLRIGAGPVWLVSLLPPVIARFQAENPGIRVSLIGGVIDTLVPALISGELDLICVSLDFPNRTEIEKNHLIDVRHVLIADPRHPLATQTNVSPEAMHGYPWMVLKSDYVGTERIFSFFSVHGLRPPEIALETTSIHSLLQGLKNATCIAHVPEQMLPLARLMGLQEIKLDQVIWETSAGYAFRATTKLSAPLRNIMALLKLEFQMQHPKP